MATKKSSKKVVYTEPNDYLPKNALKIMNSKTEKKKPATKKKK